MTKNTMRIVLSRNGIELPMGVGEEIDIMEITGLESSEFRNEFVDNALIDGEELEGKKIGPRPVHIVAGFRTDHNNSIKRQEIIRFFNPKYNDGDLYVNNMGVERHIHYEIEGWTFMKQANLDNRLKMMIDLICPDPYMLDMNDFGRNIAEITPQHTFPWRVTAEKVRGIEQPYKGLALGGMITGYKTLSRQVTLKNTGDVPTGMKVVFTARRGGVLNPVILYTDTGDFVRVLVEMQKEDVLVINTDENNETIMLNGENVYQKIDRMSNPFMMPVGESTYEYNADDGYMNLDVNLYFTPRYLGV